MSKMTRSQMEDALMDKIEQAKKSLSNYSIKQTRNRHPCLQARPPPF